MIVTEVSTFRTMRNCCVYKCDWKHRNNPKRAMFMLPKDPVKLDLWKQALPKHRRLSQRDRVCEKHFKPTDIMRVWSHVIHGETKTVQRCKPNLQPDAVPCFFELTESELKVIAKKKRKQESATQREDEGKQQQTPVESTIEQSLPGVTLEASEKSAIFEELYENIFEVELPSTLWGVHRDPDRNYIAFTRFQLLEPPDTVASASLLIECSLQCRAWCHSQHLFNKELYAEMASQSNGEDQLSRFQVIGSLIDSIEQLVVGE